MNSAPEQRAVFGQFADRIEAELRELGAWGSPAPDRPITSAFGLQDMAFTQWLEHVLCARLREVAAGSIEPPGSSSVATQAVREFDGWREAGPLVGVLSELDEFVSS